MSYKDSLTLYNELKAAGESEELAQVHAQQLGGVSNLIEDVRSELVLMRTEFRSEFRRFEAQFKGFEKELKSLEKIMNLGFLIAYTALAYLIFIK